MNRHSSPPGQWKGRYKNKYTVAQLISMYMSTSSLDWAVDAGGMFTCKIKKGTMK